MEVEMGADAPVSQQITPENFGIVTQYVNEMTFLKSAPTPVEISKRIESRERHDFKQHFDLCYKMCIDLLRRGKKSFKKSLFEYLKDFNYFFEKCSGFNVYFLSFKYNDKACFVQCSDEYPMDCILEKMFDSLLEEMVAVPDDLFSTEVSTEKMQISPHDKRNLLTYKEMLQFCQFILVNMRIRNDGIFTMLSRKDQIWVDCTQIEVEGRNAKQFFLNTKTGNQLICNFVSEDQPLPYLKCEMEHRLASVMNLM